jgi:hypothetical protein
MCCTSRTTAARAAVAAAMNRSRSVTSISGAATAQAPCCRAGPHVRSAACTAERRHARHRRHRPTPSAVKPRSSNSWSSKGNHSCWCAPDAPRLSPTPALAALENQRAGPRQPKFARVTGASPLLRHTLLQCGFRLGCDRQRS